MAPTMSTATQTAIEADPKLPVIRITREIAATAGQLFRAHTDPALFAQWVGPDAADTRRRHPVGRHGPGVRGSVGRAAPDARRDVRAARRFTRWSG
jgi:uncharacterized protein YndB with AHSA1/START domain